jgi:hypothetical protein
MCHVPAGAGTGEGGIAGRHYIPKGDGGGGVVGGWTAKGELVDGGERGSGIVDR